MPSIEAKRRLKVFLPRMSQSKDKKNTKIISFVEDKIMKIHPLSKITKTPLQTLPYKLYMLKP